MSLAAALLLAFTPAPAKAESATPGATGQQDQKARKHVTGTKQKNTNKPKQTGGGQPKPKQDCVNYC